ncbi:hypothetical protein [Nocardioides antri]|uniref:Uncharacterized protein n=1 Tax=Nocardioides antri TaxID=2607659 RepID=A0A5B1M295_9ACTN|nr:hypothetical protein [Nocardioides antri]KAA1426736.1 hypothetical protein F0U47_12230 [Nocardioides antri]
MKPLYFFALGILLVVLRPTDLEWDIYPNPLGWVFVLLGLYGLGRARPVRWARPLALTAVVALVVDSVLFWPAAAAWLEDAEPALGWAANLPRFGFFALLCAELSRAAVSAADRRAGAWFSWTGVLMILVMIAPVLVFGAGWSDFGPAAEAAAQVSQLLLLVLCAVYGSRVWAGAPEPAPSE